MAARKRKPQVGAVAAKATVKMLVTAEVIKKKTRSTFDNFNVKRRSTFDRFNTRS